MEQEEEAHFEDCQLKARLRVSQLKLAVCAVAACLQLVAGPGTSTAVPWVIVIDRREYTLNKVLIQKLVHQYQIDCPAERLAHR